jgi:hypothetical protein
VIELKKETPKEAVCLVFERVNSGGVALTVFELLTASFAADNFRLRHDWETREQRLKTEHPVLRNLQSVDFLQAISVLVTQARGRDNLPGFYGKLLAAGLFPLKVKKFRESQQALSRISPERSSSELLFFERIPI